LLGALWRNEVCSPIVLARKADPAAKAGKQEGTSTAQERVWEDLIAGNKRFVVGRPARREYLKLRPELASRQAPKVVILGCSDSRVSPELIFDKNLGELFVVRSAGNIADAICRGSIEFALLHLGASVLVILGHTGCGAVQAACSGAHMPSPNLKAIVERIRPACIRQIGKSASRLSVEANVWRSAAQIVANSAIIAKKVKEGSLLMVPAIYDLRSGAVARLRRPWTGLRSSFRVAA
jgi:carbonic anhydrase